MAGKTFSVSLVTPEGPAFEGDVEMLIVPGADGEIGVLARHAPLVALLNAGSTRDPTATAPPRTCVEFATGPGLLQGRAGSRAGAGRRRRRGREIDDARAREQLEEAQAELERVERGESDADRWQLEQRIRHAENQLAVIGRA